MPLRVICKDVKFEGLLFRPELVEQVAHLQVELKVLESILVWLNLVTTVHLVEVLEIEKLALEEVFLVLEKSLLTHAY